MKIGILLAGHLPLPLAEKHGDIPSMFERMLDGEGFKFESHAVVDNVFPQSVDACDGWLISGSAHGVYEDHAFIKPLESFIREAYLRSIPLAGICFGHQIMAQALGGKVRKWEGGWGVGHTSYHVGDEVHDLNAMHQDQVVELPEDAEVIASTPFCANAGLAYKGNAISFQPHPEFTAAFMRDLINFKKGSVLTEAEAQLALDNMQDENDSHRIARQIADFFHRAEKEKAA